MPSIERKITILEPSFISPIHIVQNSNLQTIEITITDWNIPNDCTVYWQVANGGQGELTLATLSGNTIIVQPYSSTFANAGEAYLQARIERDGRVLVTFAIPVYVECDRVGSGTQSGSNYDVIRVMVEQYVEEATGTVFDDLEATAQQADIAIQRTAQEAWMAIRVTGEEVINSIPSDYSELEARVDELEESQIGTAKLENGAVTWEKLSGSLKSRISSAQGIGEQAISLLIEILEHALYTTDQSANIIALEEALHNTNSDVIYQTGEALTIEAVAIEPYQSGEVLIFE